MSRVLHLSSLVEANACPRHIDRFRRRFGKSVRVTRTRCESVAQLFCWGWAAEHFLTVLQHEQYCRAAAAIARTRRHAMDEASARFELVAAPLRAKRAGMTPFEYSRAAAPMTTAYVRAIRKAEKMSAIAEAHAFANAFNSK